MHHLKIYFTLLILVFFINTHAQKNSVNYSPYSSFTSHSLFQKKSTHRVVWRSDILNCQSNIKLCLDKCVKVLTRNTFHLKKDGYINEEGIVFNTKKRLRFVIWYGI
jgi:hypothetical protein